MVYSTDDLESLNQVKDYYDQCTRYARGASILLVRNKVDLTEEDADYSVPPDEEEKLASQSLRFKNKASIKTSALTGRGINTIKRTIAKVLLQVRRSMPPPENPFNSYVQPEIIVSQDSSTVTEPSKCC